MVPRIPRRCSPEEIAEHVESVAHVPQEVLPDGLARLVLVALAAAGYDVYAYASGGEETGTWCAWLGPLADVRPDRNGRVTLEEWRADWRALVSEMGVALPEGGDDAQP